MRHKLGYNKLSKPTDQRIALLKNLAISLFKHKKITTTEARAKELKRFVDKIIVLIKKEDLASRRKVISLLMEDKELVKSLYANSSEFQKRNSGFSRIVKIGPRRGDAAEMVLVELV